MKPYLRQIGADHLGQFPLPDVNNLLIPTNFKQSVEKIMMDEGYKDGSWMYKGAKMTLTWPVWHYAFPNAKWIIVRRRTGDITQSCIKTGFMRAFYNKRNMDAIGVDNERDGWTWWVNEHIKRFNEIVNEGPNVKIIWPHRMVNGDYTQIQEMIEWLGLEWNSEVMSFIDPLLWHARNKGGDK